MLPADQVAEFQDQGYLVVEGFASEEEVAALRARCQQLVAGFDPSSSRSVFSTKNQQKKTDQQFLDSAGQVSFFWEEKALDEEGRLLQPKEQAVNKIGHALHDLDPVFRDFSRSPKMASLLAALGFQRPLPVQSMVIFKQPHVGGEVVPHQDSCFLYTDPPSVVGLWLALEDATRDNGCLWTLPGSHKAGIYRRFLRAPDGSVSFDDGRGWTGAAAAGSDMPSFDEQTFLPVEVKAGTLVLLHGANVHYSKANLSPISRYAYTMHVCEGGSGFTYAADNWLQRPPALPFEPVYDSSAGTDAGRATAAASAV